MRHRLPILYALVGALLAMRSAQAAEPSTPATAARDGEDDTTPSAECTESPESCGRAAFEEGVAAFQNGDHESASASFRRALEFRWHPKIALNLVLSEIERGRLLEALALIDEIDAHADTTDDLRTRVGAERKRAEEQVSVLTIRGDSPEDVELHVDGAIVPIGADGGVKMNPGTHRVVAYVKGDLVNQREVTLAPGEALVLTVSRARNLVMSVPPRRPTNEPSRDTGPPPSRPPLDPLWFYVGAGATAVLTGVTIWSGVDTQSAFDDYENDLPSLSQTEVNERVDDGYSRELRTNVLIGVSAAAAVTTAVVGVFLVDWSGGQRVGAWVGPHAAGGAWGTRF